MKLQETEPAKEAKDKALAAKLWDKCAEMVKLV
jgi:hypothetical protein